MTPRAKLFLGLAAGGGLLAVMMSKKKEAQASEEEQPTPTPELPGLVRLPSLEQGPPIFPPPAAAPAPPTALPIPPPPFEQMPPPIQFDDSDERDDLQPIAPPFVPPPISNQPAPAPAPPVQPPTPLPPAILPPELAREIPDLIPTPVVNIPRPAPAPAPAPAPPPTQAEQPSQIPDDTAELLRVMLARESTSDWKRSEPLLEAWQRARGVTPDGKFGPMNAELMATETGLIPIIRFWPKGTFPEGHFIEDFRNVLRAEAQSAEEPRRSQLLAAAEREKGQGFGRNPKPITPTISI